MNQKVCFVIMPFSDKEPSGGNKWDDLFDNNIKPAVEDAGLNYQCIRSINPVGNFMLDIVSKLATAEIVIAVLTELRPNVMYELGIRNALRRKTIMLAESINDVPSDLKAYIALEYSTKTADARENLTKVIREKLAVLDTEEPKSDNPVSDYLRDRAQDICDEWHEYKNFETFLPRLKEVLPSYALKLEPVLSKVSQHISELTARAAKNAEAIGQNEPEETTPEVRKEAEIVARAGEALQTLNVQLTPSILRNMAFDAYHRGEFEDALALSNQLVSLSSKDSSAWNIRGLSLNKLEKYDEALESFNMVVHLNPKVAVALYNRGVVLGKMGKTSEALDNYDKAVQLDPKHAAAWGNRGQVLELLGRHDMALKSLGNALRLDPKQYASWCNRGLTLESLGQYEQALKSLDKAIKINSKEVPAWNIRGRVLFFLHRFEESAASFKQAFDLEPTEANHINNKGFALEAANKTDEALQCYEQALQLNSENPHAHYNRGSVLKKLGRDEEAKKSVEKALAIDPKVGDEIESQKRLIASKQ